jgi:hypothetical protein
MAVPTEGNQIVFFVVAGILVCMMNRCGRSMTNTALMTAANQDPICSWFWNRDARLLHALRQGAITRILMNLV